MLGGDLGGLIIILKMNRIGLRVVLIGNIVVACTNNYSVSIIFAEPFAPTHRDLRGYYQQDWPELNTTLEENRHLENKKRIINNQGWDGIFEISI